MIVLALRDTVFLTGTTGNTGTTAWILGLRVPTLFPVLEKLGTTRSRQVRRRAALPRSGACCEQLQPIAARKKLPRPTAHRRPDQAHAGHKQRQVWPADPQALASLGTRRNALRDESVNVLFAPRDCTRRQAHRCREGVVFPPGINAGLFEAGSFFDGGKAEKPAWFRGVEAGQGLSGWEWFVWSHGAPQGLFRSANFRCLP